MRNLKIVVAVMLLAGVALAQNETVASAANPPQDLLSAAQSDRSLAMFVGAAQASGMAKILRDEGPLTIFAPSNRAFSVLSKADRETLLTDRAAMNFLLAHYIIRGAVSTGNMAEILSARTIAGAKLHIDLRREGTYVNGARLDQPAIRCANGEIHILDSFDPGLVHDAIVLSRAKGK